MQPLEHLDYETFEQRLPDFDRAVALTPDIDHFCSAGAWVLPAREAFLPAAEAKIFQSESGFGAFCLDTVEDRPYLLPLEASWGLPCPLVGPDPGLLTWQFRDWLLDQRGSFDSAVITGLVENGTLWNTLLFLLGDSFQLFRGASCMRRIAVLEDGFDGWLSRRTTKFRANLRRADRNGRKAGITFRELHGPFDPTRRTELFQTMMAIEDRCWKGKSGVGVNLGAMNIFYRRQVQLLGATPACRFLFADMDDEPVGYLYGGIFGDTFRGLQFSFNDDYRHLALGNLLQRRMIRALAAQGIRHYDLGTDVPYKRAWSDLTFETHAIVVR